MAILSMLPPLPEDLIIEILLRLPVKSLLRFESVSRGWHTIIRSPRFIHNHAHRGNNITDCLVYLRGGVYVDDLKLLMDIDDECKLDDNYACLVFSDGTFETHEVPDLPGAITDIVGHCNGIFCVLFWDSTLALWNPATRKLRSIPQGMDKPYDCDVGFGIDPLTGDVKVVLISNARYYHAVSIYCSRNDSWESSEQEKAFVDLDFGCWVNTFLNGFCYWIKCQWKSYKYTILTFDIHNDTFQEIEMPEMLDMAPTLDIYHDTLALLTCRRYCQRSIDMWLMKEPGRWTKHRTLSLPIQDYSPFGIWNNNYILASFRDLELIVCDLDSGTIIRTLKLGITEAITSFLFPLPYKESLVSV